MVRHHSRLRIQLPIRVNSPEIMTEIQTKCQGLLGMSFLSETVSGHP